MNKILWASVNLGINKLIYFSFTKKGGWLLLFSDKRKFSDEFMQIYM